MVILWYRPRFLLCSDTATVLLAFLGSSVIIHDQTKLQLKLFLGCGFQCPWFFCYHFSRCKEQMYHFISGHSFAKLNRQPALLFRVYVFKLTVYGNSQKLIYHNWRTKSLSWQLELLPDMCCFRHACNTSFCRNFYARKQHKLTLSPSINFLKVHHSA